MSGLRHLDEDFESQATKCTFYSISHIVDSLEGQSALRGSQERAPGSFSLRSCNVLYKQDKC